MAKKNVNIKRETATIIIENLLSRVDIINSSTDLERFPHIGQSKNLCDGRLGHKGSAIS